MTTTVPTSTEFAALTARVTAAETSLTALKAAVAALQQPVPVPAPTPAPTPTPTPNPAPAPVVDVTRMPAPPVNPKTVNIGAGGITISAPVSDTIYNLTAPITTGNTAISLVAAGSLTRCVVNVNRNADVGVRGGIVTDCDVRDSKYANYYDTWQFYGCNVGRHAGQADFYLRGANNTLAADAMLKSIATKNWGVMAEGLVGAQLLGVIVAISEPGATYQGYESTMSMEGCSGCVVKTVLMQGLPGYVMAINHGSHNNSVGLVSGKGVIGDPGIVFADGSYANVIDTVDVSDVTVGVRFGEIDDAGGGNPCPNNTVKLLKGDNMPWGAVQFAMGDGCRVDVVDVTNAGSNDVKGAIEFSPYNVVGVRAVANCSVGKATIGGTKVKPAFGVHFGSLASGCRVDGGTVTYVNGRVSNEGAGSNVASVVG